MAEKEGHYQTEDKTKDQRGLSTNDPAEGSRENFEPKQKQNKKEIPGQGGFSTDDPAEGDRESVEE